MTPGWTVKSLTINGMETRFLEAGSGQAVVLLHGGEFGASAELCWERVIGSLAESHRVIAPDILGFGGSAKVVDFVDGRGFRLRHIAALCHRLGVSSADFVGNSMGAGMLLADAAAAVPILPARRIVAICGGGETSQNEHTAALYEYDATIEGMRRIVKAMFHDPAYASDDAYVARRFESSMLPGAWEAVASARFRRPGHRSSGTGDPDYGRIAAPTLVVEGGEDKLKPPGWAGRLADRIPGARSAVIPNAGHCPQIEQPDLVLSVLAELLDVEEEWV